MSVLGSMNNIPLIKEFNIEEVKPGTRANFWLHLISDGFGSPISIPVIVLRGKHDGPVLGLTAAVHGNELNGISVIQRLCGEIDVEDLRGSIVAVPVVNVPSFMRKKRRFNDGVDLNHIMPGRKEGNVSQVYAYRFIDRIAKKFDFLLDLHTASFGRVNSYYVRADLSSDVTKDLAILQNADIIVHNPPSDGTLRGAADEMGIPAITVEVGNPNTFQKRLIRSGVTGIHNTLCYLNMIDDEIVKEEKNTVLCDSSFWMYTDKGGLLTVHAELRDVVEKGEVIATLRNVFGDKITEYVAEESGVVIGKSVSPVNQTGGRILHMGRIKK